VPFIKVALVLAFLVYPSEVRLGAAGRAALA